MEKSRRAETERAIDEQLPEGGEKQVGATNNLGDLHRGIVDCDGELIGRHVVLSPDNEIAKVQGGDRPLRPEAVINELHRFAVGNAEPPMTAGGRIKVAHRPLRWTARS